MHHGFLVIFLLVDFGRLFAMEIYSILNFTLGYGLNKYIDNFETLDYKPVLGRQKRYADGQYSTKEIKFRSQLHNRFFIQTDRFLT